MTASPRSTPARPPRALLLLAGLAVVAVALTACAPDAATPAPTTPAASGTPSDSPDDESPEPTPSSSGGTHGGDSAMSADIADAVSSGNTAAIEAYLTEPTRVVIAASEADMQYSAVDAVLALDYVQPGVGTWDFALSAGVVDGYAASPSYGQFFPVDAIVGRSDTGAVVSFVPNGNRIGTIFMSIDEGLITDY
jgi:hypothetical protein